MSICVPSFNLTAFIAPEKSIMKISHLWQIVKPIKGFDYEVWALGPDSGIHNTSAHCPFV